MNTASPYPIGARARVIQQMARPRDPLTIAIEGVIIHYERSKTGSWYAHAADDRLWLDRLHLRKDDGELIICNLDQYSRVEIIDAAPLTPPVDSA